MDVVLPVGRQVIVDDQRDLLHVDATSQNIGCDENATATRAEFAHDHLTLLLVKVCVDSRASEIARVHLLRQPFHLPSSVDKDHRLRDGESLVQIAQGVQLPVLAVHQHIELLDTVKRQLVALDEDANRIAHELRRELEHVCGHRSREEAHVHSRRQLLKDIVNLVLEASRQHLVRLVEHKVVQVIYCHRTTLDHVQHTSRGTHDQLHSVPQSFHVLTHVRAANARHGRDTQVIAEGDDDFDDLRRQLTRGCQDERLAVAVGQVDVLQQANAEGRSLARA
mmetsp:Transcript_6513/g.13528  ORF Transcript_6513/g.13528 Transcript_6513/m.13528 type:complete len:280 (-) Transcript_6513:375-1214(-)